MDYKIHLFLFTCYIIFGDVMKIYWEEMKPHEFKEALDAMPVAYLPLGTLEWHGYHMPLGADGLQSEGLFERVAKNIGGIIMPMLFLGCDKKHIINDEEYYGMDVYNERRISYYEPQKLMGSAYYIREELLEQILLQIISNVKRAGFKVLVAHGHGPSIKCFRSLKQKAYDMYEIQLVSPYDYIEDDLYAYQNDHAAANETSIMWALNEELVDMRLCKEEKDLLAMIGRNPIEYASKEYGEEIIHKNVEALCKGIKEIIIESNSKYIL